MDTFVFGSAIELLAGLLGFVALFVATAFSHFRHTSSCFGERLARHVRRGMRHVWPGEDVQTARAEQVI